MSKKSRFWMTGCLAVVMAAVNADFARRPSERPQTAKHSKYDADETLRKIESAATGSGYAVFARVSAPGAGAPGSTALVLGLREGVTPVLVGESGASIDAPLSLVIVPLADGRSEVRFLDPGRYPAPASDEALAGLVPLGAMLDTALA
ncbi:hypothetical protein [Caldimonas brevitalea]|uniref:DUF302 domain-containing protein n=1 Tax=Caldimonas brevitalea TaxID=413882 RepID=A0A0G3BQE7_9BURK|nr:hypothetical protein [Caldimonas brevitalea]AKJ29586.1 hypothetical protein AAW51_2895 [Caldimonas brevitalea]